jgi:hypothetical protein
MRVIKIERMREIAIVKRSARGGVPHYIANDTRLASGKTKGRQCRRHGPIKICRMTGTQRDANVIHH